VYSYSVDYPQEPTFDTICTSSRAGRTAATALGVLMGGTAAAALFALVLHLGLVVVVVAMLSTLAGLS
jgi:hypothetical protein